MTEAQNKAAQRLDRDDRLIMAMQDGRVHTWNGANWIPTRYTDVAQLIASGAASYYWLIEPDGRIGGL